VSEPSLQEGVSLSRLTTIGTGGFAQAFAEPTTVAELELVLRAARERELGVATVGLGSNLLAADTGVDLLVLRLAGELAEARVDGEILAAVVERQMRSACIAPVPPRSGASSSRAPFPGPRVGESG